MKRVEREIDKILESYRKGDLALHEAREKMRLFLYESIGFATIDHHRGMRAGIPEVVYGEGKSAEEIIGIVSAIVSRSGSALVTRVSKEKGEKIIELVSHATYHPRGKIVFVGEKLAGGGPRGEIVVVSAGTSDGDVAEEAALTAEFLGNRVKRLFDVGVAGIHRLFLNREIIDNARIIIVVAGMEGALASVMGGVSGKPVIAVPTSVGYGASFGGISALLGMLNSCAPGVVVVNIDNGFGAAYFATLINKSLKGEQHETEEKS